MAARPVLHRLARTKATLEISETSEQMPYRLKAGESVPEGLRRIVLEEIDSAVEQLARDKKDRGEAIHEARKNIKKIRGVLRLVQAELGPVYRAENSRLRDVAHQLSDIRDAEAIIEVFDGMVGKYQDGLQKRALASIRRGLHESKRQTEQAVDVDKVTRRAISVLRAVRKSAPSWPLKQDGFGAIASGLKDRYRRGRKAMAVVQKNGTPENYHEWRKRVKDHWYHIRLLESLWTDVMRAHETSLKELETWLGDDHNLVVLCGKLEDDHEKYGTEKNLRVFLTLAAEYQNELRQNAISLGQRVYEERPRNFIRTMSKLWDVWHEQPDSMKAIQKEERKAPQKEPARATSNKTQSAA
jgi:CHAD domain-containing protein